MEGEISEGELSDLLAEADEVSSSSSRLRPSTMSTRNTFTDQRRSLRIQTRTSRDPDPGPQTSWVSSVSFYMKLLSQLLPQEVIINSVVNFSLKVVHLLITSQIIMRRTICSVVIFQHVPRYLLRASKSTGTADQVATPENSDTNGASVSKFQLTCHFTSLQFQESVLSLTCHDISSCVLQG